jgi:hypothetical protein
MMLAQEKKNAEAKAVQHRGHRVGTKLASAGKEALEYFNFA